MLRLKRILSHIKDRVINESDSSENQIESLRSNAERGKNFYENATQEYFDDICDFDTFRNKYPDLLDNLNQKYNEHEWLNNHNLSRSNYIYKHIQLSFKDFKEIVFKKPVDLANAAFGQIFDGVDEDVKNYISGMEYNVLPYQSSSNIKKAPLIVSFVSIIIAISLFILIGNLKKDGVINQGFIFTAGGMVIPILLIIIGCCGIVHSISDSIGIWFKINTREQITKGLLD